MTKKPTYEELEQRVRGLEEEVLGLRESEHTYRYIAENVDIGIILIDVNHNIIWTNRTVSNWFDKDPTEFVGKKCYKEFERGEERCSHCPGVVAMASGKPCEIETQGVRDDGTRFSVRNRAFPLYNIDGELTGFHEILEDISERKASEEALKKVHSELEQRIEDRTAELTKANEQLRKEMEERSQAEEALRESEEKYRLLVENIPSVAWITSEHGETPFISPTVEKVYGFTQEEICGKGELLWFERIHPDDIDKVRESFQRVFAEGLEFDVEYRIQRKDEKWIWVHDTAIMAYEEDGVKYAYGIFSDITERKQAVEALLESEEKYRDLVENINDVIFAIDENRSIIYISPIIESVSGYSQSELIGRSFTDFIHDEDLPMITKQFHKIISGDVEPSEYRIMTKSGEAHWVRSSSRPVYEGERLVGLRGVLTDITEKKRLEAQLIQAQKMESIGTLAGGIAHDFNNILSPIMIHSEMAMMELPPDSPVQFNVEQIFQAGQKAKDMVKQILAFSRKGKGELAAIKITPILQEILKMLRSTIPATIGIHQNFAVQSDTVFANPTQIHQIMLNLCTNAAYAMKEEGGALEVSLVQEDIDSQTAAKHIDLNPGPYLKLSVSDTGTGIDSETIQKIFEPYFTTKEPGEGTGMGLALIHGIVKSNGGAIAVESEQGKGTTFDVYLPRIETDLPPLEERSAQVPKGNETILLVDDEKAAIDSLKPMLENLGYDVTARTSSIEALEAFKNDPNRFELVITDQTMPNMTGKDLAKELISIRSDTPLILCTGFSEQIDEGTAEEMGIRAFVMKPIVMGQIARTIREVLDKR